MPRAAGELINFVIYVQPSASNIFMAPELSYFVQRRLNAHQLRRLLKILVRRY